MPQPHTLPVPGPDGDDPLDQVLAANPILAETLRTGSAGRRAVAWPELLRLLHEADPRAYAGRREPASATDAPAGSALKIEVMAARHAGGRGLHHPGDHKYGSGPFALLFRKSGNGETLKAGVRKAA